MMEAEHTNSSREQRGWVLAADIYEAGAVHTVMDSYVDNDAVSSTDSTDQPTEAPRPGPLIGGSIWGPPLLLEHSCLANQVPEGRPVVMNSNAI